MTVTISWLYEVINSYSKLIGYGNQIWLGIVEEKHISNVHFQLHAMRLLDINRESENTNMY